MSAAYWQLKSTRCSLEYISFLSCFFIQERLCELSIASVLIQPCASAYVTSGLCVWPLGCMSLYWTTWHQASSAQLHLNYSLVLCFVKYWLPKLKCKPSADSATARWLCSTFSVQASSYALNPSSSRHLGDLYSMSENRTNLKVPARELGLGLTLFGYLPSIEIMQF